MKIVITGVATRKLTASVNIGSRMYEATVLRADEDSLTVDTMGAAMPLRWSTLKPAAIVSVAQAYGASKEVIAAYKAAAGME